MPRSLLVVFTFLLLPALQPTSARAETGTSLLDLIFAAERILEGADDTWRHESSRAQYELRQASAAQAVQATLRTTRQALSSLPFLDSPVLTFKPTPILTEKPVPGQLSSPFGVRRDPIRRRKRKHHRGVDFVADRNTPVHASGPGIVAFAGRKGGYGRMVIIDHGLGLETRYAHLQRIKVKKGEFVPRGTTIGKVGSSGRATGPHLHFEVRQDGIAIPPTEALDVKLPGCSARARDCRRKRPSS
jgi:murein DD-endopeptidase MepM/ murein hydrolase activator NlpD